MAENVFRTLTPGQRGLLRRPVSGQDMRSMGRYNPAQQQALLSAQRLGNGAVSGRAVDLSRLTPEQEQALIAAGLNGFATGGQVPPVVASTVAEPESRRGIVPESLPRRRGSGRGLVGTFIPQLQSWYNTLDAQERRRAERERMSADASKREAAMGTWAAENLNPSQQTLFAALSPDAQSTMLQGIAFPGAPPAEPAEAARVQLLRLLSESPEVIESLMGQGLTPSQILGGGGGTTVNVGDADGGWDYNEFGATNIKNAHDAYRTTLRDTHEGLSTLNLFEQLNAEVNTGPGTEWRQSVSRFFGAAGYPMSSDWSKREVMLSMINNIVIPMAKDLGVNPTDKDMELLLAGTVSLGNTPESNQLLIDISKLMHARAQFISDQFNEHLNAGVEAGIEPWQLMQSWNAKLDDFTNYDSGNELWTANANDIYNRARDVEGFVVPPTRGSVGSGGAGALGETALPAGVTIR